MSNPLTVEQIKNLQHNDWLWVVDLETKTAMYAQILVNGIIGDSNCRYLCIDNRNAEIDFSTYGKNWLAYKNKEQYAVKDILQELLGFIGTNQKFCIVDDEHKTLVDADDLFDFIGKLANKYNIEVE